MGDEDEYRIRGVKGKMYMYALLLSGLAMQMAGNSRPSSGAEHHISHLWEMEVINLALDALHGEKVGVALSLVCARYKKIASIEDIAGRIVENYPGIPENSMWCIFGKLFNAVVDENTPDPLSDVDSQVLVEKFPQIQEAIDKIPDGYWIQQLLTRAGCKVTLTDLGLTSEILPLTLELSPFVRRRMTLMRLSRLINLD